MSESCILGACYCHWDVHINFYQNLFRDHRSHYSYLSDKDSFDVVILVIIFPIYLKIVRLSVSTRYDLGGDVNFFTTFSFNLHEVLLCILTRSLVWSSCKGFFKMTGYLCWLITLFSIFEVSFTDDIIVRIVQLKKRVVGVLFDGPCADQMESNAK